jgi:hypothetical protein
MGMTLYIRDFRGEILHRGERDVGELVDAARQTGLPFLANVDEYDDTVFNRLQLSVVADEMCELAGLELAGLAVVEELEQMIEKASARPHRYSVFNGD